MPTLTQITQAPQTLWSSSTPTTLSVFNALSAFSIAPKTYSTGADFDDESEFNKTKVGGNFGNGFFHKHYAGQVSAWMSALGKNNPNGVQTFNTADLNNLVDNYIVGQAPTNAKFIVVDFEPQSIADAWMWDYAHSNFQSTMYSIAQRVQTVHNKYFYDWISINTSFTYGGENFNLNGDANDGFANSLTNTNNVDKILNVHRATFGVTNLKAPAVNQVGLGYTAITFNPGVNATGILDVTKWRGVENAVLKSIDGLALKLKLTPTIKSVAYYWPLEDKPVGNPGRRSNIYTKFKPNSSTNAYSQNLNGKVTVTDNRLTYPSNIIEDTVLLQLTYPNVIHAHYWLHGSSYNPYAQLRYSSINGSPTSCVGGTNKTGNYQGSELSLVCPTDLGDYIGTESTTVSAFIKGVYRYGASGIKDILDGTQVQEVYQFQYKRTINGTLEANFNTSVYENHGGQAALAWKHSQPLLIVWRKPSTDERVVIFWDLFADAYAPTTFKFSIGLTEYTGTTKGNRAYVSYLASAGTTTTSPVTTTSAGTTTTTFNNVENQFQCSVLDSYFTNYQVDYSAIAYKNGNYYWKKASGHNENSVLSIMSCTKAITAIVMFRLKELGLVNFDTPISAYLPNFAGYGNKGNITVKMILNHTSGIPADTVYEQNRQLTVQSAADGIGQNVNLLFNPGTQFLYSSASYQLAAAVAEVVSNKSFKQLVVDYVLSPLGITSDYRWTETPNLDNSDGTVANPIAGYGLSMSSKQFIKIVKSLAGYGTQLINNISKTTMFSSSNNYNTSYGYGVTLQSNRVIMSGASGCYSFINTDDGSFGLVWQSVNNGANSGFGQHVRSNIASCDTGTTTEQQNTSTEAPSTDNETQIEFRVFTTNHVPNDSVVINKLKHAKVSFPNAKFKAPVIFNWRDTINLSSINGGTAGGVNNFTQPIQRFNELLDNNLNAFVIIDCNLTSVIGDSPAMGTATYRPEDKIKRFDGGGEITAISWSSPRMINVYAYVVQALSALRTHILSNYPSYDLNKLYVEIPFTQNLENEYPPAQYGGYDNSYDYNPYQIAHFRQWMGNRNYAIANNGGVWDGINRTPTNDNIPQYIGGNDPDRINWRLFVANMYYIINQKLSQTVKSVDNRFKYELNSGFFSDNGYNWRRSDLALTGDMNGFVDTFKHNPARWYHQAISNKLVASIRNDQQSTVEWTRADGDLSEPAFTVEICDKVVKSINDGVRKISFSFYEGNDAAQYLYDNNNPTNNNTVLGRLHNNGTLYRNYVPYNAPNIITRNINSNYLVAGNPESGGFIDNNQLKTDIDSAISTNGSDKVKLKINWALGNYRYLNI